MNARILKLIIINTFFCVTYTKAQVDEEPTELEGFIATEVPVEEVIIPSSRPISSVYGNDLNVLETPRNVTIISREQLDAIAINDVRDFSKLTSSSYSRTNFGAPSNPDIRSQIADIFRNGVRMGLTSNGNGMPINFNAVESINIVKGPATVIQGPSQYVGGYADLVTKRPYFDEARGMFSATYGNNNIRYATIDYSLPISEELAVRFSYTAEDSDSWYDNRFTHSHAFYGALVWRPVENYELFFNGEVFYANYTEHFGINRPTQELIDEGLYITGINTNDQVPTPADDEQNAANVLSGFPPNPMAFDFANPVPVDRRWRLARPGDDSEGINIIVQANQTFDISDTLQIVNRSLLNYINRETLSLYLYSEIIDPTWRFENRTELILDFDHSTVTTGLAYTYQSTKAYNNFFFEPANVWDLTRDLNDINAKDSVNFPGFGAFPVPGWEDDNRFATAGVFNGDTNDSRAWTLGPFAQFRSRLSDALTLHAGMRVDSLNVKAADPLAPGFIVSAEDQDSVLLFNFNSSLNVEVIEDTLYSYISYNYSENPGGAIANGGGYGQLQDPEGDGIFTIDSNRLQQKSELVEFGVKAGFMDNKLFAGFAVFEQTRSNLQLDGSIVRFHTTGLEIEFNYQPNRNFYATLSYSHLDSRVNSPQFYVINTTPAVIPGYPTFGEYAGSFSGDARRQGVPRHLINALASYNFDFGLGVTLSGYITSEINNDVVGRIVIPWQYTLDATVSYDFPPEILEGFAVRLQVLNFTDEENWAPPNAVYGAESILADPGIQRRLSASYEYKCVSLIY